VRRVLSFDQDVLATAKRLINQSGLPRQAELQAAQDALSKTLGSPAALERMTKSRERGLGTAGDFELNLGQNVGDL
jgi:hypothetical protein